MGRWYEWVHVYKYSVTNLNSQTMITLFYHWCPSQSGAQLLDTTGTFNGPLSMDVLEYDRESLVRVVYPARPSTSELGPVAACQIHCGSQHAPGLEEVSFNKLYRLS